MDTAHMNADLFVHIRIVIGIVVGLSITRLLTGAARFVQQPLLWCCRWSILQQDAVAQEYADRARRGSGVDAFRLDGNISHLTNYWLTS